MITSMRTTVVIDDALLRLAKRRAAERDVTVSDVVNEALREALRERTSSAPPFTFVTYGEAGRGLRHEPADFAAALEDEDRERLG
jgi:hypothetical protein